MANSYTLFTQKKDIKKTILLDWELFCIFEQLPEVDSGRQLTKDLQPALKSGTLSRSASNICTFTLTLVLASSIST